MKVRKLLSILLVMLLITALIGPVTSVYSHDESSGETSHESSKGGKNLDSSRKGQSGMGQAAKGNSDKHDSDGGALEEDRSTSDESADSDEQSHKDGAKKGSGNKGGPKKGGSKKDASDEDHSTDHDSVDSDGDTHEDSGSKGSGNKGGKKKDSSTEEDSEGVVDSGGGSAVELTVEVTGLDDGTEVEVTLDREGVLQTATTVDHVVVFNAKFSGDCILTGEPVSGYITPHMEVKIIGSDRHPTEVLHYEEADEIPVTAVNIVEEDLEIVIDETVNLNAVVEPANAIVKSVTWESSDDAFASVDHDTGLVTALAVGVTEITVTTNDGGYTDTCEITVIEPPVIDVDVQHIRLDKETIHLVKEETTELIATITPPSATLKDVIWTSGDDDVASVKTLSVTDDGIVTAIVTAKSAGDTVITATAKDGSGCQAYCLVSVTLPPEEELIYASKGDDVATEHFDSAEDVYINIINPVVDETYYVKLEQKGSKGLSEKGTITFSSEDIEDGWVRFKLIDAIPDIIGIEDEGILNNSKECFFYMSLFEDFPKEDEKTLKTNFKIGSAIPTGHIELSTTFVGGPLEPDDVSKAGIKFILGRALYEDDPTLALTEEYEDYEVESALNGYSDEVKAWGITDSNGEIKGFELWDESISEDEMIEGVWYTKEILKIGGYILLQDHHKPPEQWYIDNLDNIVSEDGEPLKAVHITRDDTVTLNVINTFIGKGEGYSNVITLDPDTMSLVKDDTDKGTMEITATIKLPAAKPLKEFTWEHSDIVDVETQSSIETDYGAGGKQTIVKAVVEAKKVGTTVVTATATAEDDEQYEAYCTVTVRPMPEDEYIFASKKVYDEENGVYVYEVTEHFDSADDVYINLLNYELGTTYYAKLEQKGNDPDLGSSNTDGIVFDQSHVFTLDDGTTLVRFKLTDVIDDLKEVTKFSKECFFYISTDPSFPQDETITFKTNFKIGSAVPTGYIEVSTTFVGGTLEPVDVSKAGIRFILARALYEDDSEHDAYSETYEDYVSHHQQDGEPVYFDEVKMWGVTDKDGVVNWTPPREILKIGGYILLQEPIQWYINNLGLPNPESDDGEPLKAVHITRSEDPVVREVINIYTGPGNSDECDDCNTEQVPE